MSGDDVNDIIQNFFATIADKDADAFKLYEDNKRMRALLEQTLHAHTELESRHSAMCALVDSLQAAVDEKDRLIAAQEDENAAWRDHIAELRLLLDRPSELDHGLGDIVEDVRSITNELRSLREAFQYARWCCDGWEMHAAEEVVHAESRERAVGEEAAYSTLRILVQNAHEVLNALHATAQQTHNATMTVRRWESQSAQLEAEWETLTATHLRELGEAVSSAQEQQNRADVLQQELTAARENLERHVHQEHLQQQRYVVDEVFQQGVMNLLLGRCQNAEVKWCLTVKELRHVVHHLAAAQLDKAELLAKHECVLLAQEQSRLRLTKLVKQVDGMKQQLRDMDALQQRCQSQQEELRAVKEKYVAAAEKERALRQQLHTAAEVSSAKLRAAGEATTTCQRQRYALEERQRTTKEELKALQHEVTVLRRRVEEHHATEVLLQTAQEQLQDTKRHVSHLQSEMGALKRAQEAELQALASQHTAAVVRLCETHAEELRREGEDGQRRVNVAETSLQSLREAHTTEKAQLQRELQAWIDELEELKQERRTLQGSLEAERTARQLLERQHQQETSMVRIMLMEQSREEAQRGPQLADLQLQVRMLGQRNDLLEETCRRSASVIAQLRENLHREQMTSRMLRQRDASFSSVH